MKRRKKVLVTSGAWQASLACIQSLGRAGYAVYLLDDEPLLAVARSKYCRGQIISPAEKDKSRYVPFLLDLLEREHFDIFIPISGRCVQYCSENSGALLKHVKFLIPSQETVALASDKRATYAFAIENTIAIPKTYFPPDYNEVRKLSERPIFPCVVKTPVSQASQGVFFAGNRRELIALYDSDPFGGQWPVVQEFVSGELYGVTAVASEGRVLGYFMFRTAGEYSMGGTPPIAYSVTDPALLEEALRLIKALRWNGAIDLDYFKTDKRGYVLLEINPRFSGSLNFAVRMKVDLPGMYCRLLLDGPQARFDQPAYKKDILFRTILPTEIVRCHKHPSYRRVFLKHCLRFRGKSNIYWDDPRLVFWQIKEARWWCQDFKNAGFPDGKSQAFAERPSESCSERGEHRRAG